MVQRTHVRLRLPRLPTAVALAAIGLVVGVARADGSLTWRSAIVSKNALFTGVSCASSSLCVAVDDDTDDQGSGFLGVTRDPARGYGAWAIAAVDRGRTPVGVSCPSPSLCVVVDKDGYVLTSTDPTGGAAAWKATQIAAGPRTPWGILSDVACPSISFCVAVGVGVWTSTDPTSGAGAWVSTDLGFTNGFVLGVSCPSASFCVATTNTGRVAVSTDPGGGAAWSIAQVVPEFGHFPFGLSCPSPSLCIAVEDDGNILTSTDPAGGASAWKPTQLDSAGNGLGRASCPSTAFCAVAGVDGIWASTNPAGGASAWHRVWNDPNNGLGSVSCSTPEFCVAVGGFEAVVGSSGTASHRSQSGFVTLFRSEVPVYGGVIQPVLECQSTAPCRGRFELGAAGTVLARGSYGVSAGDGGGPVIRLGRAALALIQRHGNRLAATLQLTPTGGRTLRLSIVITIPKR
jgi:hypothetical protein